MPVSRVQGAFAEDFAEALVALGDVDCEGVGSEVASAAAGVVAVSGMRVLAAISLIRIFMPITPVLTNRLHLLLD